MIDQTQLRLFFEAVLGKCPQDHYTIISKFRDTKTGQGDSYQKEFKVSDIADMVWQVEQLVDRPYAEIFYRVSVMNHIPAIGSRGTEAETAGCATLKIDLDYYKTPHTQEEALAALEAFSPPPSIIIYTGQGLHAYWLLDEFVTELKAIKQRNKWLESQFKEYAADGTADLARVLRIPLTYNWKHQPPTRSAILKLHDEIRYKLEDFGVVEDRAFSIRDTIGTIVEEPIVDELLEEIKSKNKHLYNRIYTEDTAREAGAEPSNQKYSNNLWHIDRSRNDICIAIQMLSLLCTPGQVASVLKHPTWFSGSKFNETQDHTYVENTVKRAMSQVKVNPELYFAGRSFVPRLMMDAINQEAHIVTVAGVLYYYENGVFQSGGKNFIQQEVFRRLGLQWKSSYVEETVKIFEQNAPQVDLGVAPDRKPLEEVEVNTLSGMVSVYRVARGLPDAIRPHSPTDRSFNQIPVEYDPFVDTSFVEQKIAEILPEDALDAWYEWVGYHFLADMRFRKALLLVGEQRSGKSTLLDMLIRFLGSRNVSSIPLQDLCDSRFSASGLIGKSANVFADLDTSEVKNSGNFKVYVAGDRTKFERKNKDEFFAYSSAKPSMSANHYTSVAEPDEAYFDRWLVMLTPNKFEFASIGSKGTADLLLIDNLTSPQSLSALLVLAMKGLARLMEQGHFTEGTSMQEGLREMQKSLDATFAFMLERTKPEKGCVEPKSKLKDTYDTWCGLANRGYGTSERKFYMRIKSLQSKLDFRETTKVVEGREVKVYIGLRILPYVMISKSSDSEQLISLDFVGNQYAS
jgi:P4 family phage/plasmid primase-like protien